MFFCKSITVFFPVFEFGQRKLAGFHGWTVAGERRRGDGMPAGTLLKYVGAEFALMVSGGVEFSLDAAFVCSGRAAERGIVTLSPFVPALSEYDKEELSMKKLHTKAGFTLAELLIVVAIIAVLVAIAIPVFTTQLEKSRESTDIANLRSAYGAAIVKSMSEDVANGDWYYAPGEDGSLGAEDKGAPIGQGTATDGKADVSSLPSGVTYDNTTSARGKKIKITFANGSVSAIAFA